MRIKLLCCLVSSLVLVSLAASAQRHYVCYYTAKQPVIDGSGNDPVWQQAPWTEDFTDIEGDIRPKPAMQDAGEDVVGFDLPVYLCGTAGDGSMGDAASA